MSNSTNDTPPPFPDRINARPFLGRSSTSAFERLEEERAKLARGLQEGLATAGVEGLVIQSAPRASECWVEMTCWTPQHGSGDRSIRRTVKVTLHAHEFRRFPLEYRIHLTGDTRNRIINSVYKLDGGEIWHLVRFATRPKHPTFKDKLLRFRPMEKPSFLESFMLPKNKLIDVKRPFLAGWRRFWIIWLIAGLILAYFTLGKSWMWLGLLISITSVILRLVFPVILHKRGIRPLGEPRMLLRYDSWQTVVPDLGSSATILRDSVIADLKDGRHESAFIEIEKIWNVGLDGLVERDQIVLHFRRSVVFVEIHAYGSDLYVDWEAYLNFGVWTEVPIATGFEQGERAPVIFYGVKPAVRAFGEYDVSDANFALEWVHAVVRRHLKRLLVEHQIDQDIDFRIIREDRTAVRNAKPDDKKSKRQFRVSRQNP